MNNEREWPTRRFATYPGMVVWPRIFSCIMLVASASLLWRLLLRWMKKARAAELTKEFAGGDTETKWSNAVLSAVDATCAAIVGPRKLRTQLGRSFIGGFVQLVALLSLTGLVSNAFLGFSKPPWISFDETVDDLLVAVRKEPTEFQHGGVLDRKTLESAKNAPWKYVYTWFAAVLTVLAHSVSLWASLRFTRRWVREIVTAQTWLQKAALLGALAVATAMLLALAALIIAFASSPAFGLVVIMAKYNEWLWATAFALVGIVLTWLDNPWFRITAVSAVLPCLAFIVLTGAALFADLQSALRVQVQQLAVRTASKHLGAAGTPLVVVFMVLVFALWMMQAIL